jgi:hypothetical protein
MVLFGAVWCCLVLFGAVWCCLVLFGAVWCCLVVGAGWCWLLSHCSAQLRLLCFAAL